jgi:hypothetical protein
MYIKRLSVLIFACAVGFLPARSFAQGSKDADREQQVLKAEADLIYAQVHADLPAMDRLYADNYTHTHTSGLIQPKADFVDGFKTGTRKYLAIDTSDKQVKFYSDSTAIVTGHVQINNGSGAPAGQPDSFLEVWVRDHGTWRCAAWAQTKAPPKK